jgi:hypothetical protein
MNRAVASDPSRAVVLLASKAYAGSWVAQLRAAGVTVHTPLAGLQLGQQLPWCKRALA